GRERRRQVREVAARTPLGPEDLQDPLDPAGPRIADQDAPVLAGGRQALPVGREGDGGDPAVLRSLLPEQLSGTDVPHRDRSVPVWGRARSVVDVAGGEQAAIRGESGRRYDLLFTVDRAEPFRLPQESGLSANVPQLHVTVGARRREHSISRPGEA